MCLRRRTHACPGCTRPLIVVYVASRAVLQVVSAAKVRSDISTSPGTAAADTEIAAACDWNGLLSPDAKNTRALACRQLHLRNCRVIEGIFAALLHVREAVCCDGVGAMTPTLKHFAVKLASLALKVLALCVVRDRMAAASASLHVNVLVVIITGGFALSYVPYEEEVELSRLAATALVVRSLDDGRVSMSMSPFLMISSVTCIFCLPLVMVRVCLSGDSPALSRAGPRRREGVHAAVADRRAV